MVLPLEHLVRETNRIEGVESKSGDGPNTGKGQSAWRFRAAMLQYHRLVFKVCYGLLGDSHEAEDVTQETFLKYWQLSGEVRGAKGWLVTVARNKCLDRLRAAKRFVDADPEVFDGQADERTPEWYAARGETASRLEALIAGLPEPQRSLIILFDVQGLTGSECAEVLDLNLNQVKVYLHRARRRLRQALEDGSD